MTGEGGEFQTISVACQMYFDSPSYLMMYTVQPDTEQFDELSED